MIWCACLPPLLNCWTGVLKGQAFGFLHVFINRKKMSISLVCLFVPWANENWWNIELVKWCAQRTAPVKNWWIVERVCWIVAANVCVVISPRRWAYSLSNPHPQTKQEMEPLQQWGQVEAWIVMLVATWWIKRCIGLWLEAYSMWPHQGRMWCLCARFQA